MQFTFILAFVSASASVALAQTTPPACALTCLTNTNTHGCSITDNSCLCHNSDFIADQTTCITQACTNPSDLQQAETFAVQNCLQVGVTLSAPTATGTASGSSASATSPSSTSSSSAPAATSNAASTLNGGTSVVFLAGVAAFALAL